MKALIFGKTGQVATQLIRRAPAGTEVTALGRDLADLSDPAACAAAISATECDIVINAAAYTAVDRAEEEEALATLINGAAPAAMARAAAKKKTLFLHISTDYVFEGSGEKPWRPDDVTAPLGAYGRSKLAGEEAIRAAGGVHVILRTSWVFSAHGGNFVKTMLRLAQSRDTLDVVADQIGGPTAAADIADALWIIGAAMYRGEGRGGTYHFSGAPDISWAGFAREILSQAGHRVAVADIATSDYPTLARRPANSRLDCSDLEKHFNIQRPSWSASLSTVWNELRETTS